MQRTLLNQADNDIEALARRNDKTVAKDSDDREADIMPQMPNQQTPNANNQLQMPVLPAAIPSQTPPAQHTQRELSVNYKLYFALIGVQFLIVTVTVFVGLVYSAVSINWGSKFTF